MQALMTMTATMMWAGAEVRCRQCVACRCTCSAMLRSSRRRASGCRDYGIPEGSVRARGGAGAPGVLHSWPCLRLWSAMGRAAHWPSQGAVVGAGHRWPSALAALGRAAAQAAAATKRRLSPVGIKRRPSPSKAWRSPSLQPVPPLPCRPSL